VGDDPSGHGDRERRYRDERCIEIASIVQRYTVTPALSRGSASTSEVEKKKRSPGPRLP
jgi:hypothetical protein